MKYQDRHCPGARELWSVHSVVSLCADSTLGDLSWGIIKDSSANAHPTKSSIHLIQFALPAMSGPMNCSTTFNSLSLDQSWRKATGR